MDAVFEDMIRQALDPEQLVKKFNDLVRERSPWNAKWDLIQNQVFPDYRDYTSANIRKQSPTTSKIKNHTSEISGKINKITSVLCARISDPSSKWLNLKMASLGFDNQEVTKWLNELTEALYDLYSDPVSEYYTSYYSFMLDWYTIGTACRNIVLRKDTGKIHFSTVSMQDVFIDTTGYGDVKSVYRRLNITAIQAYELFGENLHPSMLQKVVKEHKSGRSDKFEFIECVIPNPLKGRLPNATDFISCVVDKTNKHICDIGQHTTNPYIVSRFFIVPGEVYGRSYVWNAMPDILIMNRLSKRITQAVDFATNPVVLVQDATSLPSAQITPGSFVQGLDSNGRPTFQQMSFTGDLNLAIEFMKLKRESLDESLVAREALPYDYNGTATEANLRDIQQSNRLRPLLVRLESEDLYKTVLRSLRLLEQIGQLPPFPYDAVQLSPEQLPDPIGMLRVRFSGQLARMQEMQDLANEDMLLNKAMGMAQVDQSVLDRFNFDILLEEQAKIIGVPAKVFNSDEDVNAIREARAKQQQEQQQAENMKNLVDTMQSLGGMNGNGQK